MASKNENTLVITNGDRSALGDHEANARVIAALPELIEAARNVLELDRDTFPNYVRGTFAELRRVLARIEGEEV